VFHISIAFPFAHPVSINLQWLVVVAHNFICQFSVALLVQKLMMFFYQKKTKKGSKYYCCASMKDKQRAKESHDCLQIIATCWKPSVSCVWAGGHQHH
jgi:hypothetical protein